MAATPEQTYTVFYGYRKLASGTLSQVATAYRTALKTPSTSAVLIFDDASGRSTDIDVRLLDAAAPNDQQEGLNPQLTTLRTGSGAAGAPKPDMTDATASSSPLATLTQAPQESGHQAVRRRGRPKLGVISREVTLLPRHWEWLAAQPGGASVALRKLVEAARLRNTDRDARRAAQERAYHFMLALGGDLPGYEEATRALFADDMAALKTHVAGWPDDVRTHALMLATGD
ncbi:DUF2239 family protein [Advenella sp. FME57]|uniref:DUF2239 family protein n=2 Tax=unclassified Advenella TaxID=2685285 RepID=UPI0018673090|nr:DUF2239 family protein [Advenella sp. FME57]